MNWQWLSDKIDNALRWIEDLVKSIFQAVWDFIKDIFIEIVDLVLTAVAWLIQQIPVPDFLSNGLGDAMNALHPALLYFITQSGFGECLAILAAGFSFRMLRKIFTLGQW